MFEFCYHPIEGSLCYVFFILLMGVVIKLSILFHNYMMKWFED